MLIKIVYILNILVAGSISYSALFNPAKAAVTTFGSAYAPTEVMRLVGCMWLAITILSVLGLFKPITLSPILLVQFIYKSTWLMVVALPALLNHQPFPRAMACFFVVWVVALPFIIPWSKWWHAVQ